MKRIFHWLDENLEEFLLVIGLIAMTLIMGIQVFCRYVLGMSLKSGQLSPACKIPMYFIQAAPLVSFVLVAFRVLQRWMIEFRVARGENVFDPAHPERNTPESFIEANAGADNATENALNTGIDNRIHTIKNSNEEER